MPYKGKYYIIISAKGSHCNYYPQTQKEQISHIDVIWYALQYGHVAVVPDCRIVTWPCYRTNRFTLLKSHSPVLNNLNHVPSHCTMGRFPPISKATKALRVNRGIAIPFCRIFRARWGGLVSPRPFRLYPLERPGIHFT